jgi:hypothetical protein
VRTYPSAIGAAAHSVFMVGQVTAEQIAAIRFGSEGQR